MKCPKCGYEPSCVEGVDVSGKYFKWPRSRPKYLNILVIGAGSAGQRHARMLRERGHVCYFYDPPMGYGIASITPDAVVIASPPETHEQYLKEYWNKCPILCEGPVTYTAAGGWSSKYPSMTASNWLFVMQIKLLKALCDRPNVKPVSAHLWFDYDLAKWRGDGWAYKESCYYQSGIDLINCHEAMTALWLFGPAAEASAFWQKTGKSKGLDAIIVAISHKSGVLTTINSGWHSAKYQRGIRIVFEDGTVEEVGWTSPQDDAICNQSYADMLDHWLKAIADHDYKVRPSLLDGYRAYKLMQGEAC